MHRGVSNMTATIKLMVNSGTGVLAAVASRLQTAGLRVKSHDIEPINASSAMLTLTADVTGAFDGAELRSSLSEIEVVQSVEEVSGGRLPVAPQQSASEVPGELVNRLVASFPKIMPHIQRYEEQLAKDPKRSEKLKQLGVESGRNFASSLEPGDPDSVPGLIEDIVLPAISSIAEASRKGDTIVAPISLFTRRMVTSMDLFNGEGESCGFLCGFIEGLTTSVPGFESVSVKEMRCRANGDPACVFALA